MARDRVAALALAAATPRRLRHRRGSRGDPMPATSPSGPPRTRPPPPGRRGTRARAPPASPPGRPATKPRGPAPPTPRDRRQRQPPPRIAPAPRPRRRFEAPRDPPPADPSHSPPPSPCADLTSPRETPRQGRANGSESFAAGRRQTQPSVTACRRVPRDPSDESEQQPTCETSRSVLLDLRNAGISTGRN